MTQRALCKTHCFSAMLREMVGYLRIFFLFWLGSSLISCQGPGKSRQSSIHHYRLGTGLLQKKQYRQSLQQLKIAHDLDSRNHNILNNLGLVYYFLGEFEESIYHLKKALSHKSDYSEAHNNLGRVYIEVRDYEQARIHLNRALADLTYPNRDKVFVNLGLSHFRGGNLALAEPFFLKAIAANRENCLGYNYLGRSLIELKKFKRAVKSLNQAIYHCRENNFDESHYFSAVALFQSGKKNRAISRLQEAQKLYPKGPYQRKVKTMLELMSITEIR